MAGIFYSLAGEGRGHAARVCTMVEELRHEQEITLFASGAAYEFLQSCYAEADDVRVERIPGLFFHYRQNRVSHFRTFWHGGKFLLEAPTRIRQLEQLIRSRRPELVITDFEPLLPRAARRCGVPFISLNHQHFLVVNDLSGLPVSLRFKAALMAPFVDGYYSGQAATIVSSFYFPPLKPACREVTQIGVLLRPEIIQAVPEDRGHLLVYLRRHARAAILETLRQCGHPVRIYGLGEQPAEGNLTFRPISNEGFLRDLTSCRALISNAGNQLVGEALYLGKPALVMPEENNFEQYINAHYLRAGGGGDWVETSEFTSLTLAKFLRDCDRFLAFSDRDRINGTPTALGVIRRYLGSPAFSG